MKVSLVNLIPKSYSAKRQGPYSVQILAGYLRARRVPAEIKVIDMQKAADGLGRLDNNQIRLDQALNACVVESRDSEIVGLSLKWGTLGAAKDFVTRIRDNNPRPPLIVLGNTISTFGARELLALPEFSDVLAVEGEGEESLRQIIKKASGASREMTAPQIYQELPNVRTSPADQVVGSALDLNSYPVINPDDFQELFKNLSAKPQEWSRGCPWKRCTFCSVSQLYGSPLWRPFSVDWIQDSLERFIVSGKALEGQQHAFYVVDSEFFGSMENEFFDESMKRVREIAERIIHLKEKYGNIRIRHVSTRVDTIFKEGEDEKNSTRLKIYEQLKKAGFTSFYLGLESGSPDRLKRFGKGQTPQESEQAMRILKQIGFSYEPGFIFFSPDATEEELLEDIDFIERTGLHEKSARILGSLRPQAGSPIIRHLQSAGLVSQEMDLDTVSFPILKYRSQLVERYQKIFEEWENLTRDLVYYLVSGLKIQDNSAGVNFHKFVSEFRRLDFDFIQALIKKKLPLADIYRGFSQRLIELLEELRQAVSIPGITFAPSDRLLSEILPEANKRHLSYLAVHP